mgnify:CR=1 FL=1|tara:strand:+ start:40 stop:474 length:435 start_codon:yes stop_codon:yes gene_type:complete
MPYKWETPHQGKSITTWIRRGLILRDGESYKGIYSFVMSIDNCNLCNVKFNDEIHNDKKCMDHDHATGYFRQVICNKCNKELPDRDLSGSKVGMRWINVYIQKRKNGKIDVYFTYKRECFKRKASVSLTKLICYSFINLLKKPV